MLINKLKFITLLLFNLTFFKTSTSFAQNPNSLLKTIINTIENKYDIKFSYIASDLENITAPDFNENEQLEQYIEKVNKEKKVFISKISKRYYSIKKTISANEGVCATLIDIETGIPVINANISINNSLYSNSDKNGVFYIPKEIIDSITISHIGYKSRSIDSKILTEECKKIYLQPNIETLDEILIQQIFVKGISKSIDGGTQLKIQNFGLLPGQTENDVLQIAQILPGIESVNETISTINIRGGTNDENLIVWEGVRMYQLGHFFGLISAFNPNLTNNVKVYKNATPASYQGTVSGTIDMSTNNSISENFKGAVGVNLITAEAFIETPITKDLEIQISGRSSINNLFETPLYKSFSDRIFQDTEISSAQNPTLNNILYQEDFYFFDVGGKILWKPNTKDKIILSGIAMENHIEFTERLQENVETSRLEQKSEAGNFKWDRKWSETFSTATQASVSHYLLKAINQDILTQQTINQENQIIDFNTSLETHYIINNKISLQNGYQFSEIGVSNTQDVNLPRFRDFEKDVMRTHSLFSQIMFNSKNNKTKIQFGTRGSYFEKLKTYRVEPRLHFYQELTNGFGVELQGELKSQTLTQRIDLQSDFLGVEKRRWVLTDIDEIPLKTSRQASIGFLFNKKGWFINAEGYFKKVENIFSRSQGFQNQFQFLNENGNYTIIGTETIINKKMKNLSIWASYSYSINDYEFETFNPTQFPNNFDIRHILNLAFSFDYNNFKLSGGLNWRTGKPFTIPQIDVLPQSNNDGSFSIVFDQPNSQRLIDYMRVDFSAQYNWNISKNTEAKINVALLNVTNQNNILNSRFALLNENSQFSEIQRIDEVGLGFTPNFSIALHF